MDVTKLIDLSEKLEKLRTTIDTLNKELLEGTEKLQNICTHPTVRVKRDYHPGGYYDKSSVSITHTCTICNKIVKYYDDPNHRGTYG